MLFDQAVGETRQPVPGLQHPLADHWFLTAEADRQCGRALQPVHHGAVTDQQGCRAADIDPSQSARGDAQAHRSPRPPWGVREITRLAARSERGGVGFIGQVCGLTLLDLIEPHSSGEMPDYRRCEFEYIHHASRHWMCLY